MEVRGLVLWESKYKETSKLVRVYTDKLGKITILAQGALRKNAKHRALTMPFTMNHYELRKGKTFYYIQEGEGISSYYDLSRQMGKMFYASVMVEILDKVSLEGEGIEELFNLIYAGLEGVLHGQEKAVCSSYILRMMKILGYGMELRECVSCGNRKIQSLFFSPKEGGILCEHCAKGISLSKEEYKTLYYLQKGQVESVKDAKIPKAQEEKLWTLSLDYMKEHIPLRLYALETLIKYGK